MVASPARRSAVLLAPVLISSLLLGQDLQQAVAEQEARLSRHEFFRKVDYELVRGHEPFVFFVQAPKKTEAGYVDRVVRAYLEPLRAVERAFVRDFAKPLQLRPRPERSVYAFAILASEGDYINYMKATASPDLLSARAHFDPELQLAVTFEETFSDGDRAASQRKAILHEFVHVLQHAYYGGADFLPRPIWFTEGLAEYRSTMVGSPSSLDDPPLDEAHLELVVHLLRQTRYGSCLNSVVDLVTTHGPGYTRILQNAVRRSNGAAVLDVMAEAFYAQSDLFVHFLHSEDYRPAFLRYSAEVMQGESGWRVFADAFDDCDPLTLQAGFFDWIEAEYTRRNPGQPLSLGDVDIPTVGDAAPRELRGTSAAAAADPGAASFAVEELDFAADEHELRLAAAIGMAGGGRIGAAEALLADAPADNADAEARLQAERQRLAALRAFRTELFDDVVQAKKKIKVILGERTIRGQVTELVDGVMVLSDGKSSDRVALDEIPADELTRQGRVQRRLKGDEQWLDLYAAMLTGRSPSSLYRRLLRREDDNSRQLIAAESEYEGLRALAPGAAALAELRLGVTMQDRTQAAAAVATLSALMKEHANESFVTDRRGVLEDFAKAALERAFDPEDVASLGLIGKVENLDGGRFRISYPFDDPAELDDFRDSPTEAKRLGDAFGSILAPDATGFKIQKGSLICHGGAFRRYAVPIAAPFTLRYTIQFDRGLGWLLIGICDDGFGESWIETSPFGALSIVDQSTGVVGSRQGDMEGFYAGRPAKIEIQHDGDRVKLLVNNKKANEIAQVGSRKSGYITLFIHSNEVIKIKDLSIEGTTDPQEMEAFRRQWMEARLKELFGG